MTNVTEPQMPPTYGVDSLHMQFGAACFQLAVGTTRRVLSSSPGSGMEPRQIIEWGANYMLSPPTAKALRDMLIEHVEKYEAMFGPVEVSPITSDKPKVVELTRPTLVSSGGPLQPQPSSLPPASDLAGPFADPAASPGPHGLGPSSRIESPQIERGEGPDLQGPPPAA